MATQLDRRNSVRLAGEGMIAPVVIDEHRQPVTRIEKAEVINVSGGGIAFSAATDAAVGSIVRIEAANSKPFEVRVLDGSDDLDNRRCMRCKLTLGSVPASLIYGW